jgi:hypothetical protein
LIKTRHGRRDQGGGGAARRTDGNSGQGGGDNCGRDAVLGTAASGQGEYGLQEAADQRTATTKGDAVEESKDEGKLAVGKKPQDTMDMPSDGMSEPISVWIPMFP